MNNLETSVLNHYKEIMKLEYVYNLTYWDLETSIPKDQINATIDVLEYLNSQLFELYKNEEFVNNCQKVSEGDFAQNIKKIAQYVLDVNFYYSLYTKEEVLEIETLKAKSREIWKDAHEKNDFSIFLPYLINGINAKKDFITRAKAKKSFDNDYDFLLNDFEKNLSVKECDSFFELIKKEIVPLYNEIRDSIVEEDLIKLDAKTQDKLMKFGAQKVNFDFNKGVIAKSVHPFSSTLRQGSDVRMTYRFEKDNGLDVLFTILHESGHSLQGQLVNENLIESGVASNSSLIVGEAISRTYENYFGRNINFIENITNDLNELLNLDLTTKQYYEKFNGVKKVSKIRVEADELTYPIHVLIRYEIEKGLFNNEIDVNNIEQIWNDMYKNYLGVDIENANEGILQDVHWSDWSFGYFPTYAMGTAYGMNIYNTLDAKLSVKDLLANGDFKTINEFYKNEVFSDGDLVTRNELINNITGKDFDPSEYVNYLKEKYSNKK